MRRQRRRARYDRAKRPIDRSRRLVADQGLRATSMTAAFWWPVRMVRLCACQTVTQLLREHGEDDITLLLARSRPS
jgi:hypothetical protein